MAQINFPNIENYVKSEKVINIYKVKYERGGADARITRNLELTEQQLRNMLGKLAAADLRKQELKKLDGK